MARVKVKPDCIRKKQLTSVTHIKETSIFNLFAREFRRKDIKAYLATICDAYHFSWWQSQSLETPVTSSKLTENEMKPKDVV